MPPDDSREESCAESCPWMTVDYDQLCELELRYGASSYLVDVERFRGQYRNFLSTFQRFYPRTRIAYSYKTNSLPFLCRLVDQLGGAAEVVSRLEYDLAIRIGVAPERIIFNGPLRTADDLETALRAGALVNLNAPGEIETVAAVATRLKGTPMRLGVRCNFNIGGDVVSRFGFDAEDETALASVAERLRSIPGCSLEGLHCHFSGFRDAASHSTRALRMLNLARRCFPDHPPGFLDLGGGFFDDLHPQLRAQFNYSIPSWQDYAEAIARPVAASYPAGSGPALILEPGVALTAGVMSFVARIADVQTIRGRRLALCTGSIQNIKPTRHSYQQPLRVVGPQGVMPESGHEPPTDIVGYTCMEGDCLREGYSGPVSVGDFVVFESVGAYTLGFKPPFIRGAPAVLAYHQDRGEYELVRRHEEFNDLFGTCKL